MIRIVGNLPQPSLGLALSGGVDSMAVANFLLNGRKKFTAYYFNHGTEHGHEALEFVKDWCERNSVALVHGVISSTLPPSGHKKSKEEWWRINRYEFLSQFNCKVITAHHLDDCVETYLFSCFHGTPKVIPYMRKNIIRPFLLTKKECLLDYAQKNKVEWIEDESNESCEGYMRNRIRHKIMPEVLDVNPGIHKVVARIIKQNLKDKKHGC